MLCKVIAIHSHAESGYVITISPVSTSEHHAVTEVELEFVVQAPEMLRRYLVGTIFELELPKRPKVTT